MNSDNLDTKLATELTQENISSENQKSSQKFNSFHIVSFLLVILGITFLSLCLVNNKKSTVNIR